MESASENPTIRWKIEQMKEYCRKNNIIGFSKLNKKRLILVIKTEPLRRIYKNKIKFINLLKKLESLNKKKKNNKLKTIEKRKKRALARHTDSHYYITKYLTSVIVYNPIFEDRDLNKKLEIFGIPDIHTCFISGTTQQGKGGDHLFEINGYSNITDFRGVDDEWNMIPVSSKYNVSYKIIKFSMNDKIVKKNIGYEELTDEELSCLEESDRTIYEKISAWIKYVSKRGAIIKFKNPNNYNKVLEDFSEEYKLAMEKAIRKCEDYKS